MLVSARNGVGLGLGGFGLGMTYQEAVTILGDARGFSQAQIEEARNIVYPYQTQDGQGVTEVLVDQGYYDAGDDGYYSQVGGGSVGGDCGPVPTAPPMPPLYPAEYCVTNGIPDAACVERNSRRQQANLAIRANWIAQQDRAICEHNNCLNAQWPANQRDCVGTFPFVPVPSAPGMAVTVSPDQYGILRPNGGTSPAYYSAGTPETQVQVASPSSQVIDGSAEVVYQASQPEASDITGPVTGEAPGPGIFTQIQAGGSELMGTISEKTGLSSNMILLAAAGLGAYFLFIKK